MFYTFIGGPLHDTTKEIDPAEINKGIYSHLATGDYESIFDVLPKITEHQYLVIGDTMVYRKPKAKN